MANSQFNSKKKHVLKARNDFPPLPIDYHSFDYFKKRSVSVNRREHCSPTIPPAKVTLGGVLGSPDFTLTTKQKDYMGWAGEPLN